jgi:serine phosphatase RsbU (regulator of sigma subunit)
MDFEKFECFFDEELKKNNLSVKKESYKKFYDYMINVLDWNTKINVTAVRDEENFIIKHYIDSLMISGYLDKYSTLDYLEINRSKKEAVFYKMGAASSYVFKQGKKLEKIENSSLPFGLEESSEEKVIKLEDKDIIIMTSDGIIDNVIEEESFEKYISKINHLTSQKMAYEIISYANKCNVKASDDKCVIVLKIDEVKNC